MQNTISRLLAGLNCIGAFIFGCIKVVYHGATGALDRATATRHMQEGAGKMLVAINADIKITYVNNFKYIDDLPRIYMSNHLSLMDTPLIYHAIPDTIRMVAKKELTRIPLLGKTLRLVEHAIVDRKAKGNQQDFYQDVKNKLNQGVAIYFFVEGTRSRTGELLPFKMGGFRLAAEAGAQIIPIRIKGTQNILRADKILPYLDQPIEICIGEPIDARSYQTPEQQVNLMQQVRDRIQSL